MKQLVTLLLLVFSLSTFSQKSFQGKAVYMSKTTVDMSRFGDQMTEQRKKQIMSRMKNFLEKTYTLSFTRTESAFKENAKLDAPGASSGRRWGGSNGQGSIYKNLAERKMIEDTEQFSKRFLIAEDMDQPKWELGTETKKIGQYTCYKATMVKTDNRIDWGSIFRRGGRNNQKKDSTKVEKKDEVKMMKVTAWYTPEIPVSTGPAEYYGLPGLILEINADRTTMLCTEIVINPTKKIEIKEPKKGKKVNREEYNKIIKKKAEEAREQFRGRRGGRGGRRGGF